MGASSAKDLAMIPYDIDPSLHSAEPLPAQLDDGFSPPAAEDALHSRDAEAAGPVPVDPALWAKSAF